MELVGRTEVGGSAKSVTARKAAEETTLDLFTRAYCAEDSDPQIYKALTSRCYVTDRRAFAPSVRFLWWMVQTLSVLEPYPGKMVCRGMKADLREQYPQGREIVWQGPCSTTKKVQVLENPSSLVPRASGLWL